MRGSHAIPIHNSKGQLAAILLEGAYCAEHEWGIKRLLNILGISPLKFGEGFIPRNYTGPWGMDRISYTGGLDLKNNILLEHKKPTKQKLGLTNLVLDSSRPGNYKPFKLQRDKVLAEKEQAENKALQLKLSPGKEPTPWTEDRKAEWGEEGFHITTTNPEISDFLIQVFKGLQGEQPVAVWLGGAGDNPFGRVGLVIGLPDLVDATDKDTMLEAEKDLANLHWAAEDTGIHKVIPSSKYYALKPKAIKHTREGDSIKSKHPIMFFLNPTDQAHNNNGWFTVEELEEWMDNKGPIPKALP